MNSLKYYTKRAIHSMGWSISRFDPDSSLGNYLSVLFAHLEINCVFDVGARYGEYGGFLRSIGYDGHIVSFEPVSTNYNRLIQETHRDNLWSAHRCALGEIKSKMMINVADSSDFSSFLEPNEYGSVKFPGNSISRIEEVNIVRLDDIFSEVTKDISNPRVYLKMDTQGWDLMVFHGAAEHYDKILAIQSELSLIPIYKNAPRWLDTVPEFNRVGYDVSAMFKVNRDANLRAVEMDCVMVKNPLTRY
jgi:FkbM family methyltransferase